jgi:membrane-bound lytic murein transglycosylase B
VRRRLVAAAVVVMAVVVMAAMAGCSADGGRVGPAAPVASPPPTTVPVTAPPTTLGPAGALAAGLVAAETAIRDPATPETDVARAGQAQQEEYRNLAKHPEWDAEAMAAVPEALRPTVEANLTAAREIQLLNGEPDPARPLPHWRIVAPEPPAVLLAHYKEAGAASGVPWQYLAAIHLVETRMGRIRGDSVAGARGPMQFIPSTWAIYGRGGDIESTADSIRAAARLLADRGAPADMARALHAYNQSDRYVRAVTLYARQIQADERAYLGYHAWEAYYGDRLLPPGTVLP